MIQITKSAIVPRILRTKGAIQKDNDILEFNRDNSRFINVAKNTPKKSFKSKIYGTKEVKDQLKKDQFEKCCYCENTFLAVSHGDVEHYRPKKGYTDLEYGTINKPGYYWLAYEWNNLHLACEICNRSHKKNYFPLKSNSFRANDHNSQDRLNEEEPLLLCPTDDNTAHFSFNEHIIKGETDEGETSVKHYGLDRTELNQSRLEWLEMLDTYYFFYELNLDAITDDEIKQLNRTIRKNYTRDKLKALHNRSKKILDDAATIKGKFALMTRMNFPSLPTF